MTFVRSGFDPDG